MKCLNKNESNEQLDMNHYYYPTYTTYYDKIASPFNKNLYNSTQPHNNTPPYYTLLYIMKIS